MATVKDLKLNPPKSKAELTKVNMLKYVKAYGTDEEKKWFVDLMEENRRKKISNIDGSEVNGYDLPKVREEFAKKFFPDLSKKKAKPKKPTFEEELEALLK
jgi:translation initiation factor 1 (eIF-1/SUI1)